MSSTSITVVIEGVPHKLDMSDPSTLKALPVLERSRLITLLEALKKLDAAPPKTGVASGGALHDKQAKSGQQLNQVPPASRGPSLNAPQGEKMGAGDVEALMARLAMEDRSRKKPVPTKGGLYKFIGIFALVVLLLIYLF